MPGLDRLIVGFVVLAVVFWVIQACFGSSKG